MKLVGDNYYRILFHYYEKYRHEKNTKASRRKEVELIAFLGTDGQYQCSKNYITSLIREIQYAIEEGHLP